MSNRRRARRAATPRSEHIPAVRLFVAPIDSKATGSYFLTQQQDALRQARLEAGEVFNECVDDFNDARAGVFADELASISARLKLAITSGSAEDLAAARAEMAAHNDRITPEAHADLEAAATTLGQARKALNVARDAWKHYILGRLKTSDGSPVEDALQRVTLDQMQALIWGEVDAVTVPN